MKNQIKKVYLSKKISYFLFLVIISFIIYLLLKKDGGKFLEVFVNFNFNYLWILSILYVIALFFATLNWFLIISRFEDKIRWQDHFIIFLITLVSRRLPGTLWYVGGRIVLYQKKNGSARIVSLASGVEHVFGFASGLLLSFILLSNNIRNYFKNDIFVIVLILIVVFAVIHPNSVNILLKIIKRPLIKSITYIDSIKWMFSGILLKFITGMMVSVIALGYLNLDFPQIITVMGVWAMTSSITSLAFFLPSNFGITELTFSGLLASILPFQVALSIAIMMRLITTIFEIFVSGILFLFHLNSRDSNRRVEFEESNQSKE